MNKRQDGQWNLSNTAAGQWKPTRTPSVRVNTDTKADHVPDAILSADELSNYLRTDKKGRMEILKACKDRLKRCAYTKIFLAKL